MTDRATIDVYETQAQEYAGLPITPMQDAAIARFLSMLPDNGRILDLGCGPGIHAEKMIAAGYEVEGIDATPAFVAQAKARGVKARLGTFDDVKGTGIYDGIYASFSLLHAPLADLPRYLLAMASALKPAGAIFIGMKSGRGEARDKIGRKYCYVTAKDMEAWLVRLNLAVTHVEKGEEAGLSGEVAPFFLMFAQRAADA